MKKRLIGLIAAGAAVAGLVLAAGPAQAAAPTCNNHTALPCVGLVKLNGHTRSVRVNGTCLWMNRPPSGDKYYYPMMAVDYINTPQSSVLTYDGAHCEGKTKTSWIYTWWSGSPDDNTDPNY